LQGFFAKNETHIGNPEIAGRTTPWSYDTCLWIAPGSCGTNEFLGILADSDKRKHLEQLTEAAAEADEIYQTARKLSHQFRDGLLEFFFDTNSELSVMTKTYGVF
jgi:hypothetical protein